MNEANVEIRYILKFYYKKGKNATQAAKKNYDVYGTNVVSVRLAQNWCQRCQFDYVVFVLEGTESRSHDGRIDQRALTNLSDIKLLGVCLWEHVSRRYGHGHRIGGDRHCHDIVDNVSLRPAPNERAGFKSQAPSVLWKDCGGRGSVTIK
ncbi:hypothetical protein EVAR_505_1 [Eumeta japonica]|uniref:Mos1 transposase HTH domain-containing protein n=1 Tax=Eumeta variegata TaxID=151549 RepID=A0A4C1SAT3_EUMVA|nr:hypothetical protein EVAR_505_1 [Eumeta japonica]